MIGLITLLLMAPLEWHANAAISRLIDREGPGVVQEPDGSPSLYGVSQRAWPALAGWPPSRQGAVHFYRVRYWPDSVRDPALAEKILDLNVNLGPAGAAKVIQHALVRSGHKVRVDGRMGPETLAAINQCQLGFKSELIDSQKWYYRQLVTRRPTLKPYLKGWLRRAEFNP